MKDSILLDTINQRLERQDLVLPTLPDVALEANELLKCDDVDILDVIKVIKKDPAIAASVIKYANSVVVVGTERVNSIDRAAIRIGLNRLRNVILSSAIEQIFFAKDVTFAFLISATWKESAVAAISAGTTITSLHKNKVAKNVDHDALFLTALVHNIGILPILTEADRLGNQVNKRFHDRKFVKKLVSKKNTQMTKRILDAWEFDESIVNAATLWDDLEHQTQDIGILDILRLSMTNTSIPDDEAKDTLLAMSMDKGIIESEDWNNSPDFKDTKALYESVFRK